VGVKAKFHICFLPLLPEAWVDWIDDNVTRKPPSHPKWHVDIPLIVHA